jgi:hypothetical protein
VIAEDGRSDAAGFTRTQQPGSRSLTVAWRRRPPWSGPALVRWPCDDRSPSKRAAGSSPTAASPGEGTL